MLPTTAQVCWKGRTPGKEQDWHTALNWSTCKVPDNMDDVLIPNISTTTQYYPVIKGEVEEIQSLVLESDAQLNIQTNGLLRINGTDTYKEGIINLGKITNKGVVNIEHTAIPNTKESIDNILGDGMVYVDGVTIKGIEMLSDVSENE